jgi:hypothetical protein
VQQFERHWELELQQALSFGHSELDSQTLPVGTKTIGSMANVGSGPKVNG